MSEKLNTNIQNEEMEEYQEEKAQTDKSEDVESSAEPELSEIDKLQTERDELKEKLLRAVADAENVRKRAQKDVEEAGKYAITGFARDMIGVLENICRAEDSIPKGENGDNGEGGENGESGADEQIKNIAAGITMTKNELLKIFEKHGIKRISPEGEAFDHNFHQAVAQVEDTGQASGTVVQVMQAGYVIKDRLLRPAMVSVAKGESKS